MTVLIASNQLKTICYNDLADMAGGGKAAFRLWRGVQGQAAYVGPAAAETSTFIGNSLPA